MKTPYRIIFTLLLFISVAATQAKAQGWSTYESEAFGLQFDLPDDWTTEVDGDMLVATGDGIVMVVGAANDDSIDTYDLFGMMVENMGFEAEGEYEELEMAGGILGVLGTGVGEVEGETVGVVLLAATLDAANYFAYIYATPEAYEANVDTMIDVITSLAPLGWEYEEE
ncbi:MAG TPA: hypothetical protein VKP65_06470 [Rhodothermales bacterium]|nr:hypothetical protein [Rhodothermales bacterium]